jgi:hypothetical protein
VNIHLITWHVELRANGLGANIYGPIVNQGLPESFMFFQNGTFYAAMMAGLGANDLVMPGATGLRKMATEDGL